jgi:hypothetical protein
MSEAVKKAQRIMLTEKGAFMPAAREIMRELMAARCPAKTVMKVFKTIAKSLGMELDCAPSATTVRRAVNEAYVAGAMQIAEETSAEGKPRWCGAVVMGDTDGAQVG